MMWGFNRHAIDHFRSAQDGRTLTPMALPAIAATIQTQPCRLNEAMPPK